VRGAFHRPARHEPAGSVPARRVVLAAALAVVLTVALTACGSSDNSDTSSSTTGSPDVSDDTGAAASTSLSATGDGELAGVTLTGELAVADGELRIAYSVDNQSGGPVVVAGAVPVAAGSSFSPDAEGAWVTASTQGFVTVGRWPIRQPDEATGDRGEPQPLYVVEVDSGSAVDGVVDLAWPLEGSHPYYAADALPVPLPDPVESVRLCLGVSPASAATDAAPTVEEDGATWLAVPMDELNGTLCTEPVSVV
jgi:hypothetical protein